MASTYSTNLKIELIATGEQSGTWGVTTNTNLGTALEQSIVGKADVAMSSTTITLTLTNSNAAQDARAIYLNLTGSPGGAAVLEVPAIQKPYIVKNGSDQQVTIKVSGQTGVPIPTGKTALVYNNGTDVVTAIDFIPDLTATTADINGGSIDGATLGTNSAITSLVATTADINGGSIDGVTLGTNSPVTEAQVDNININGNTIISTNTNGNIDLTPNGTGEVNISKVDIDAGSIDGTTIGASSAGAGTFTEVTLNAQGDLRLADSDSSNYIALQAPATVASDVTLTLPDTAGSSGQLLSTNGSGVLSWVAAAGTGDVVGPASAGNNAVTRYDGTTGKLVQDSSVFIGDNTSGSVTMQTVGAASTNGTYIIQNGTATSGTDIDLTGGNMEIRYAGGGGRNGTPGAIIIGGQLVSNSTHRVDIKGGEGNLASGDVNLYGGICNRNNVVGTGGDVRLYPGQNTVYAPNSSGSVVVYYSAGVGNYTAGWTWSGNTGLPNSSVLYNNTSSGGRDLQISSGGNLYSVSSSIKYKKDVEDLSYQLTENAIENLRPIWYRSKNPQFDDREDWSWFGLLAEEVAEVEPRLVQWRTQTTEEYQEPIWAEEGVQLVVDGQPQFEPQKRTRTIDLETPEPEGIDYARLAVLCLHEIKVLRARVAALEAQLNNS